MNCRKQIKHNAKTSRKYQGSTEKITYTNTSKTFQTKVLVKNISKSKL